LFLVPVWSTIDPFFQLFFGKYDPTAGYMRVPATDRVALLPTPQRRREGVFMALNDVGEPINDRVKIALIKQDLRAVEQGKIAKDDYTIVWLPQFWRTRLHLFIGLAMTSSAIVIGVGLFGPVLVGRAVWAMLLDEKVHDGYSFVSPAYREGICWC
jgi:E3 ubiquitin-protein ligase MARCH6